jgi:hypothetical protein
VAEGELVTGRAAAAKSCRGSGDVDLRRRIPARIPPAAAVISGTASAAELVILPSARTLLPKLALAPRVAVH